MHGLHLIADLHDCRCRPGLLLDASELAALCVKACQRYGLTVVGQLFHSFRDTGGQAAGVTGAVVLAESHLAIHSWPEISCVTLDLYVCNFSGDNTCAAQTLFDEITAVFCPGRREVTTVSRGQLGKAQPSSAEIESIAHL